MGRKLSLDALARELLEAAVRAPAGRAARTAVGGHDTVLRQTLVALCAGHELAEHDNLDEATVQVLHGRVRLVADHVVCIPLQVLTGRELVRTPAASV